MEGRGKREGKGKIEEGGWKEGVRERGKER